MTIDYDDIDKKDSDCFPSACFSAGSRLLDKGEPSLQKIVSVLQASVLSKNKGGGGGRPPPAPPLYPPLCCTLPEHLLLDTESKAASFELVAYSSSIYIKAAHKDIFRIRLY